jgi:hypothetical protein
MFCIDSLWPSNREKSAAVPKIAQKELNFGALDRKTMN